MWLFRDFPIDKPRQGWLFPFGQASSGVFVVAQTEGSIFSSENGDGKNEFLRNIEKEAKNLLTKNNKCEILHSLKEMNEIVAQIRKVMEYAEKQRRPKSHFHDREP